ncbi:CASP-like protein 1E2 [Alnus glutinosa]|uniref:CASP-like protein 1E2 n=1 Tax=Alnus glutinosa TaxID=3517 RepID=UPI002D77B309|nr:CASP-like protein 1E2 [Alnus glutinosa]
MDGVEYRESKEVNVGNRTRGRSSYDLILRVLALVLTLAAAILLGVDKQTKGSQTAKWHYVSAFVYFVVANATVSSYAALSLVLLFTGTGANRVLKLVIFVVDTLMVALLFSGIGATTAVGLIGFQGNSHLGWGKVCNVFDKFCHQVLGSVALSVFGSLAFILIVVFSALRDN